MWLAAFGLWTFLLCWFAVTLTSTVSVTVTLLVSQVVVRASSSFEVFPIYNMNWPFIKRKCKFK